MIAYQTQHSSPNITAAPTTRFDSEVGCAENRGYWREGGGAPASIGADGYNGRMRHPALPTARLRIAAAEVTGATERYTAGPDRNVPLEQAVDGLHTITRHPEVLGHVLGAYLVKAETVPAYARAVDLLRAAGADNDAAEAKAAWLRWRQDRYGHGA